MNPRIEVVLDGEYVLGLNDGREMLVAVMGGDGVYRICSSCTVPINIERAELYADCIKAVVDKCNEIQETQA